MSNQWEAYESGSDEHGVRVARSLLDGLIADSRLYKTGKDYRDLLDFVVRLRGFAPFNAMLLQLQKPGLTYAASQQDWLLKFGRWPKEGARPLLILWPFGPVALVYDVQDTVGKPLPSDVTTFPASGQMSRQMLSAFCRRLSARNIFVGWIDWGDARAGYVRVIRRPDPKEDNAETTYGVKINCNHDPVIQFTTLAHELGHLFLGHLGRDRSKNIPARLLRDHAQLEIEAESVAYVVCRRNGIDPKSQTYLSNLVETELTVDDIDVYQVMRAAGQVETILGLADRMRFERPN